jgi:hypothetical protein
MMIISESYKYTPSYRDVMALTFSDIAGFTMVGSIAISTGGFLQQLDFVKGHTGWLQPFPMFLVAGLLVLLASGLMLIHRMVLSSEHVNERIRASVEHITAYMVLGGMLLFMLATGVCTWLFVTSRTV